MCSSKTTYRNQEARNGSLVERCKKTGWINDVKLEDEYNGDRIVQIGSGLTGKIRDCERSIQMTCP